MKPYTRLPLTEDEFKNVLASVTNVPCNGVPPLLSDSGARARAYERVARPGATGNRTVHPGSWGKKWRDPQCRPLAPTLPQLAELHSIGQYT